MVAKQVRAAYTQEFRLEAVRLVQSGQSQMQVCQTLGIPKASLGSLGATSKSRYSEAWGCRWCKQGHAGANGDKPSASRSYTPANGA